MKISLTELRPWADIFGILSNARTVTVLVDGKPCGDEAELTRDEQNNVTLCVTTKKKKK